MLVRCALHVKNCPSADVFFFFSVCVPRSKLERTWQHWTDSEITWRNCGRPRGAALQIEQRAQSFVMWVQCFGFCTCVSVFYYYWLFARSKLRGVNPVFEFVCIFYACVLVCFYLFVGACKAAWYESRIWCCLCLCECVWSLVSNGLLARAKLYDVSPVFGFVCVCVRVFSCFYWFVGACEAAWYESNIWFCVFVLVCLIACFYWFVGAREAAWYESIIWFCVFVWVCLTACFCCFVGAREAAWCEYVGLCVCVCVCFCFFGYGYFSVVYFSCVFFHFFIKACHLHVSPPPTLCVPRPPMFCRACIWLASAYLYFNNNNYCFLLIVHFLYELVDFFCPSGGGFGRGGERTPSAAEFHTTKKHRRHHDTGMVHRSSHVFVLIVLE